MSGEVVYMGRKIRFEVFKRDGFKCCYCGRTPPAVVLEVDHIEPKSKGGSNAIENLITACFDCNRGKRDTPLSSIPNPLCETMEQIKEREDQIRGYRRLLRKVEQRFQKDIGTVNFVFKTHFQGFELNERFQRSSVKTFLKYLPLPEVCEAMHIAADRFSEPEHAIKYFCGICWRKIKK